MRLALQLPTELLIENLRVNYALLTSLDNAPKALIQDYQNTISALESINTDKLDEKLDTLTKLLQAITTDLIKRHDLLHSMARINLKLADEKTLSTYNEAKTQTDALLEKAKNALLDVTRLKDELNPNHGTALLFVKHSDQKIMAIISAFDSNLRQLTTETKTKSTTIQPLLLTPLYNAWLTDLASAGSHISPWKDPRDLEPERCCPANYASMFNPPKVASPASSSDADNDPPPVASNDFDSDYPSP